MIIFYDKKTGNIVGVIHGRVHNEHKNVWIGDRKETGRVIVEWVQNRGKYLPKHKQQKLMIKFDENPQLVWKYKFDTDKKQFVLK